MGEYTISGIQQVGIGVSNVYESWEWYRKHLGMDLAVFDSADEATLMAQYTGGVPRSRHAILALNFRGGSGLEIWQHTSRTPEAAPFELQLGDLGINIVKYKSHCLASSHREMKEMGVELLSAPREDSHSESCFWGKDSGGNLFQVIKGNQWFKDTGRGTGGVVGCCIGVSDIDRALKLYSDILGYDHLIKDESGVIEEYSELPGGKERYRRVLLGHKTKRQGKFAELFGSSEIELIQSLERKPQVLYKDRYWGDLGYIHLCFDVCNMDGLKAKCAAAGFGFTVDSKDSFKMEGASGRFAYVEDPDGTLIEFVETHKIPIIKKIGWYLNLKKMSCDRSLPRAFIQAMFLGRTKKSVWPKK